MKKKIQNLRVFFFWKNDARMHFSKQPVIAQGDLPTARGQPLFPGHSPITVVEVYPGQRRVLLKHEGIYFEAREAGYIRLKVDDQDEVFYA